jgi:hypothetical protein
MSESAAHLTLTEVLEVFRAHGYREDFRIDDDGSVRCCGCGTPQPPGAVTLDGLVRVEGASDPADMAAVLAIRCPVCGQRGTAIVRFGPEAGPGDVAFLLAHDGEPTPWPPPGADPSRT